MDAVEYLKARERMNKGGFVPITTDFEKNDAERAVEIVEKWSKEHPRKTILQDFLEKYPKAPMDEKGFPKDVCPFALGYEEDDCGVYFADKCFDCWNRPLEEEET